MHCHIQRELDLKYAWLVVCVSLVASKAAAAIPDSSGVFHGCYNVLTGSMRIIDGTSCGFLERHIAWHQAGVAGPRGPVGPQGPAGTAGADKMVVNFESFSTINLPTEANSDATTFAISKPLTALAAGTCNLGFTAFVADDTLPRLDLFPTYLRDESTWTRFAERAHLNGVNSAQQGSTVFGFRIDPGVTYTFGLTIHAYDAPSPIAFGKGLITWTCKYD